MLRIILFLIIFTPLSLACADDKRWSGWCKYELDKNQRIPSRLNLPQWLCESDVARKLSAEYTPYTDINPFYLNGDFNGDGKVDVALWVTNNASGDPGIIIFHHGKNEFHILGAKNKIKYSEPAMNIYNMWSFFPKDKVEISPYEDYEMKLTGDAIWVGKFDSGASLIYWNGKEYTWYVVSD